MRRVLLLLLAAALLPRAAPAVEGYRYLEGTAASVNKEVLFLSDVVREQCLLRCAAMPGSSGELLTLEEARERLIADTLAFQEHQKLALGQVDNAALEAQVREARARVAACGSPCPENLHPAEIAKWVGRKLVIRDFLRRRVGVFIEISDDDVRKEIERRSAAGDAAAVSVEKVRQDLLEEKMAKEVRNWYARAASKATITLSPLGMK